MEFDTDQIVRITSDACAMFGLDILAAGENSSTSDHELAGVIRIDGGWRGSVEMGCSEEFARRLASIMFEMDEAEMSAEEVHDAFGELVNVTTGNIKALLPGSCSMGTPEVLPGFRLIRGGEARVSRWGFAAEGDSLTVVIREAA
jgi:hypothetical protein